MSGHVCQNWRSGLRVLCNALLAHVTPQLIIQQGYTPVNISSIRYILCALSRYTDSHCAEDMSQEFSSSDSQRQETRHVWPIKRRQQAKKNTRLKTPYNSENVYRYVDFRLPKRAFWVLMVVRFYVVKRPVIPRLNHMRISEMRLTFTMNTRCRDLRKF